MTYKLHSYPSREQQAADLAFEVAAQLARAIATRGRATIALAGGSTPSLMYEYLSKAEIDWKRVTVTLTDERCVQQDSERSNAAMLKKLLLIDSATQARFLPLWNDRDQHDVEQELRQLLPFDVTVLGMGLDMHTASLFPREPGLQNAMNLGSMNLGAMNLDAMNLDAMNLGAMNLDAMNLDAMNLDGIGLTMMVEPTGVPERRITLTRAALVSSRHLHLLIVGRDKLHALEAAVGMSFLDAPIAAMMRDNPDMQSQLQGQLQVHFTP